jgi:hypothetical protein
VAAVADPNVPDDWVSYRRLILSELERISEDVRRISGKLDDFRAQDLAEIRVEVAMLKVKAGVWGGLSGLVTAVGALILVVVRSSGGP